MIFMSPELLVPSKFSMEDSLPTPEADIYAFGLVIFQVLTGEIPFRKIRQTEMGYSVVRGLRPDKPEKASSIGFSDSLWDFAQRCWDGDMKSRPRIAEVVTHLGREAARWNRPMPPCVVVVENAASDSKEPLSDSMQHLGIFEPPSNADLGSPTSQTSSRFDSTGTPSTTITELPQDELREAADKPPVEPLVELPGSIRRRSRDSDDNTPLPPQDLPPPPSNLPRRKRKGFRYLASKFRSKLFGSFGRS